MKYNLVNIYCLKNFLNLRKKKILKDINIYSFYMLIYWYMHFNTIYRRLKKSKIRIDAYVGQVINIKFKLLGTSILIFMYIDGIEIFRKVYIYNPSILKYYEILILRNTFYITSKRKIRYNTKKYFQRLNWLY